MLKNLTSKFIIVSLKLVRPWLITFILGCSTYGVWSALIDSPPDYQQFETVRILYIHVPAAWLAMALYFLIGLLSAISLVTGNRLYSVMACACAPIGITYTIICLVTGMIWGQPIWGTHWVWDARLTSMAILGFLYFGYILVNLQSNIYQNNDRTAALIALLGCLNLPIIKWSVDWWTTLHQPTSLLRLSGPTLDPTMLKPLIIMLLAYGGITVLLWLTQCETLLLKQKLNRLEMLVRYER